MITKPKQEFIKNAVYLSYTSLSDFLNCPRAYYLKNIYRNKRPFVEGEEPHEPFKLQVASPYLSLGSTVHDAVRWFLDMEGKVSEEQLTNKFRNLWLKYTGKRGGFYSKEQEAEFGQRGLKMLSNFFKNAANLKGKEIKINFPKYPLFENVILIGNFDFLGEEDGVLHIVDFKTKIKDEEDPTQLYIYGILAEANLRKEVKSLSYWYLDREDFPREIVLDPLEAKLEWIINKAKEVKVAIEKNEWVCVKSLNEEGGLCRDCRDYQDLIDGKGEFQFSDFRFKKDVYFLSK